MLSAQQLLSFQFSRNGMHTRLNLLPRLSTQYVSSFSTLFTGQPTVTDGSIKCKKMCKRCEIVQLPFDAVFRIKTITDNCWNKHFSYFSLNFVRENSLEQTKINVYCLQLYDAWMIMDINKKSREPTLYSQFSIITYNCLNCLVLAFYSVINHLRVFQQVAVFLRLRCVT